MAAAPLPAGAVLLTYLLAEVAAGAISAAVGHGSPAAALQASYVATPCALLGCSAGALRLARGAGRPRPGLAWPGGRWVAAGAVAGLALKFAGDALVRAEARLFGPDLRGNNPLVLYPEMFRRPLPLALLLVALVALVPAAEELFFRGLVYGWLRARMGPWPASLAGGLLFAAAHGDLALLAPLWLTGTGLCWLYERSGSLWAPAAAHAALNAVSAGLSFVP
jgi:membrane protease YdiL (CAAX protease family)